jgi:hypothetical protein
MKYSIQGNLVQTESVTVTPCMSITCRACNVSTDVIGADIELEGYAGYGLEPDIEQSIEQSLTKLGWNDLICPSCIENDPNIVEKYNDAEDRHED